MLTWPIRFPHFSRKSSNMSLRMSPYFYCSVCFVSSKISSQPLFHWRFTPCFTDFRSLEFLSTSKWSKLKVLEVFPSEQLDQLTFLVLFLKTLDEGLEVRLQFSDLGFLGSRLCVGGGWFDKGGWFPGKKRLFGKEQMGKMKNIWKEESSRDLQGLYIGHTNYLEVSKNKGTPPQTNTANMVVLAGNDIDS